MSRTFIIKIFLSTFLFLGTISATNYYVDKDASGNNNGSSWNDAWTSLSSINWGLLNPGDILYISGGSTSKTYLGVDFTIGASGTSGNNIIITKGLSPGHNGEVILDGNGAVPNTISIQSISYVTVQYLTVRGNTGSGVVDIDRSTGII